MGQITAPEREISHGLRLKIFPSGQAEIMAAERPVFREAGWEAVEVVGDYQRLEMDDEIMLAAEHDDTPPCSSADDIMRAQRRARSKLREIAFCSDFTIFATLTLDPAKVARFDPAQVMPKVCTWLDNQVRRHGLAYVLVPERHKSGAIHFHALLNDALSLVDSGTISMPGAKSPRKPRSDVQRAKMLDAGGHIVYNLPQWRWGFSSAIRFYGDYGATVAYVLKYIGKSDDRIGGRWYYSGGQLVRQPEIRYLDGVGPSELAALHDPEAGRYVRQFAAAGCGFALWRGSADDAGQILNCLLQL